MITAQAEVKHLQLPYAKCYAAPLTLEPMFCALHTPSAHWMVTYVLCEIMEQHYGKEFIRVIESLRLVKVSKII